MYSTYFDPMSWISLGSSKYTVANHMYMLNTVAISNRPTVCNNKEEMNYMSIDTTIVSTVNPR